MDLVLPRPIFDQEFGMIYPIGGGTETPEEKAAREKAEAEKAKKDEADKPLKEAQERARVAEEAKKKAEDEAATLRKAEEDRKKAAMDDLTRAQTEAKEAKERADKAVQEAQTAKLDAAKSRAIAKLASEGKLLEPEFIPNITDEKGIDEILSKAFDRQQEVILKHAENKSAGGGPNFPPGGKGGKNRPVAAGKWDEFQKIRSQYMNGDRSAATEKRFSDLRRELVAAGVDPTTGQTKT